MQRQRHRHRDRHRETETDRDTETDSERETHRHRHRQRDRDISEFVEACWYVCFRSFFAPEFVTCNRNFHIACAFPSLSVFENVA